MSRGRRRTPQKPHGDKYAPEAEAARRRTEQLNARWERRKAIPIVSSESSETTAAPEAEATS